MKNTGIREITLIIIGILIVVSALILILGEDVVYTPPKEPGSFKIRDVDL